MLPTLPPVPAVVNADRWLHAYDGQCFVRKVRQRGNVTIAEQCYYVKASFVGQQVGVRVDAAASQFVVEADGQEVQRFAIKDIGMGLLPFTTFVERLCAEPRTVKIMVPHRR